MKNVVAIARRELNSYFASPIAYVVAAVFLVISGYLFAVILRSTQAASMEGLFANVEVVILFIAPMLTMRLLAEEQRIGTIELLLTSPVRDIEVVLGKFLSSLAVLLVIFAFTLYFPFLLFLYGNPDAGPILTGYFGLILLGGAFLSIGLLTSSVTSNQIVAAVLAFGVMLLLWFISAIAGFVGGILGDIVNFISLGNHYADFSRGIIDTKDVIYYVSIIAIMLFLTVRSLETRRWR